MRLFTAIDIPEEVRRALGMTVARLRPAAKVSWTDVEKLHITTKFIGEWPQERLEELKAALRGVGSPGEIEIRIAGLGWFPNARQPHVLWAGVTASAGLAMLAGATESALEGLGIAAEQRKFSPHLTLARIRERSKLGGLRGAVEALGEPEFGTFSAAAFYLYLSKDGVYTRLGEFLLV